MSEPIPDKVIIPMNNRLFSLTDEFNVPLDDFGLMVECLRERHILVIRRFEDKMSFDVLNRNIADFL